jgi:hypothetical protein
MVNSCLNALMLHGAGDDKKNRGIVIVNRVACVMHAGFSLHVED